MGAVSETSLYVGGMIVALHDSMLDCRILRMSFGQGNEGGDGQDCLRVTITARLSIGTGLSADNENEERESE